MQHWSEEIEFDYAFALLLLFSDLHRGGRDGGERERSVGGAGMSVVTGGREDTSVRDSRTFSGSSCSAETPKDSEVRVPTISPDSPLTLTSAPPHSLQYGFRSRGFTR
ncbi:hypothetical protein L1887_53503 [Cichorium endivia]|nr:hypothetical protein L1887_53503 [Cichorium endivia]